MRRCFQPGFPDGSLKNKIVTKYIRSSDTAIGYNLQLSQQSGSFSRHARAGGHPGLSAYHFLDSAKASLRVLPPAYNIPGQARRNDARFLQKLPDP